MGLPAKLTEAAFTKMVLELAALRGWLCYHCRPAMTAKGWRTPIQGKGSAGFPDCIFTRGPGHSIRMIVAELKVGKNKPTPEQYAWLASFDGLDGCRVYVWTPDHWDEIERVLS